MDDHLLSAGYCLVEPAREALTDGYFPAELLTYPPPHNFLMHGTSDTHLYSFYIFNMTQ